MSGLPYFTFKNVSSLDECLIIQNKNTFAGASRDLSYTQIPGRSGDLIIDNKRYENVRINYDVCALEGTRTIPEIAHRIKSWLLSDVGYFELTDTYDPDYFRLASISDGLEMVQEKLYYGTASIEFNCKPYKYLYAGQTAQTLTSGGTVTNPEAFASKPYFKITGSGNITLTVNGNEYEFRGVDGYIEIDSESMNAYKGSESRNTKMYTPTFPTLVRGDNVISWTGSVTKVEMIPRWCCL